MTTRIWRLAESPRSILIATFAVAVATVFVGNYYDLDKNQWASWVQAVGSVMAILVAVWVSWHQAESQRRHEQEKEAAELAGMLRSVRAEVESSLLHAEAHIRPLFEEALEGSPICFVFPMAEDSFPIFDAFIPKLGTIPDDALRTKIVSTFASARSFVLTIRCHNDMVDAHEAASIQRAHDDSPKTRLNLEIRHASLVAYGVSLRASLKESTGAARELLTVLRDV